MLDTTRNVWKLHRE